MLTNGKVTAFVVSSHRSLVRHRRILHDPEIYNDPFAFNPGRFLPGPDGKESEMDPRKVAFGFGRR